MKSLSLLMITVLLAVCAAVDGAERELVEQGTYTVQEYDKDRDAYITRIKDMVIDVSLSGERSMSAFFVTDKSGNGATGLSLRIEWMHIGKAEWTDVDKVSFRADGASFQYPAVRVGLAGQGAREIVSLDIPHEDFIALANSARLSASIGATEIKFKDTHLAALRELAAGLSGNEPADRK